VEIEVQRVYRADRVWAGESVFLKPHTFMNLSGVSVVEAARFFRCRPEEILVVHDELEMRFGAFGYKFSGALGGTMACALWNST